MRIRPLLLPALLVFGLPSLATADNAGAQDAFLRLNHCIQQETGDCRSLMTASSVPLYTRLNADGLMYCIPKDATYLTEEPAGNEIIVRASTMANGNQRIMRLHFSQEQGTWKLDIPSTLKAGIGDKWQQNVDMTEQLYLALRKQLGDQMNCSVVLAMFKK